MTVLAWISGIGMTPFGGHADRAIADLGVDAANAALADAGIAYDEVGELFGSSMLAPPQSALEIAHRLGRSGIPVTGVESASAGGLVALRHAVLAVAGGACDAALAVGYEKVTALEPGGVVPAPRAVWDRFPPQLQFAIEATRWLHERGCGPDVFGAVAAKAHNAAAANPYAARRAQSKVTVEDILGARMVATPLTRMMCHVPADGAAAVVVTREARPRSVPVLAVAQSSTFDDPTWPDAGPAVGPPSQTARTAQLAFRAAERDPAEVDVVSLHDMCASEELLTLVALGLCSDEEAAELATTGGLEPGGRLPTNTDGGCLARGHAIGATALAQVIDVATQLRGEAGERQVDAPELGLVQTVGGGGSAVVALLGRA